MLEQTASVTIGIPTYMRPDCLAQALDCVKRQTYRDIHVIISDNATPGGEVEALAHRYQEQIPNLILYKQSVNIGPRPNFSFLLEKAKTKYFMWLADDDEISDNYIEKLVALLESDSHIVTAAGNWYWIRNANSGELMPPRDYTSNRLSIRLAKYLWRADDAFFYGLHRTEVLRQANFPGYAWPNRDSVMNWAYIYLLDMVLKGKIIVHPDHSVRFINHDYTVKSYTVSERGLVGMGKYAARRLNVHALYLRKIAGAKGWLYAAPFAFVSLVSLLREAAASIGLRFKGKWSTLMQGAQ